MSACPSLGPYKFEEKKIGKNIETFLRNWEKKEHPEPRYFSYDWWTLVGIVYRGRHKYDHNSEGDLWNDISYNFSGLLFIYIYLFII